MATTTYGQRRQVISDITGRLLTNSKRIADARNQIASAKADLDNIPTTLKLFLDDISQAAADDPSNVAYGLAAAEALILLSERETLSQTADSMVKALDGIG